MKWDVSYTAYTGDTVELTTPTSPVFITNGGIEGLVGTITESPRTTINTPGHTVTPHDQTIMPMTGTLTLRVKGNPHEAEHHYTRFTNLWHHNPTKAGTLHLTTPHGNYHTTARLAPGEAIAPPAIRPGRSSAPTIEVPIICDRGGWLLTRSGTGTVAVANPGDTHLWVRVRWQGTGGRFALPSGFSVHLPPTSSPRTFLLSPAESCAVVDDAGVLDDALSSQLWATPPEGVPPGTTRTFTAPAGARVSWDVLTLNPWT